MNYSNFLTKYQKVPVKEYQNSVPDNAIVSVCVQTYQHVNFIKECLDGILMQKTDFPFEILLGEDGSTDGTREICIEYAKRHQKVIKLFLHRRENNIKINGTPTGRFNFLYNLQKAQGKYIALCEGDDYWTDTSKLQMQFDDLEANKFLPFCFTDYDRIDAKGDVINSNCLLNKFNNKHLINVESILYQLNVPPTRTFFFRKNRLPDFSNKLWIKIKSADTLLFSDVVQNDEAHFLPVSTATWRIHKGGIYSMKSSLSKYENIYRDYILFQSYFNDFELKKVIFYRQIKNCKVLIKLSINGHKVRKVFFYFINYLFQHYKLFRHKLSKKYPLFR